MRFDLLKTPNALFVFFALLVLMPLPASFAEEQAWTFQPIEDIGVRTFLQQHPAYDGRGAIVAVLDTGVDMSIPGLMQTSQGGVKVIDARDFTGQGEVDLQKAQWVEDRDPRVLLVDDGLWVEGLDALPVKPLADHLIYTAVLSESEFLNSDGVHDLDDNGNRSDRWPMIVFAADRTEVTAVLGKGRGMEMRMGWGDKAREVEEEIARKPKEWVFVIDRDGDGDISDETILRDYATNFEWFSLRNPSLEDARHVLAFSLDLTGDEEPSLNLHHDDGGHGTHVGGIAAGYGIHGQEGLDGVAPGAWIISCKLGDNRLSGGSTRTESMKKAYDFIAGWMELYDMPVVVNMSFGIGSEIEGDSAMEGVLEKLLDEHSRLVACLSAGNSGPGLSTVGLPSSADGAISCAALLTKEVARDLYGARFVRDELFNFSSRGGESAKPDLSAPGGSSSTVPLWDSYDRYNGTSMSAPQVAGSVACILSGLKAEGKDWNFGTIKRSLLSTAKDLPGYSRVEAGAGVVDLSRAFGAAVAYADAGEAGQVTIYDIETDSPGQPDGQASAAYWRTGGAFPVHPQTQRFSIGPRFSNEMKGDARNRFYRAFSLKSDADWLKLDRNETYINGDQRATVQVSYDPKKLTEPGVYVGNVTAELKGGQRSGDSGLEFELINTIVIPFTFDASNSYERSWKGGRLMPGQFESRFVQVPPGATSMEVILSIPEDSKGRIRPILFDPDGRRQRARYADSEGESEVTVIVAGDELFPGVWEICPTTAYTPDVESVYDLDIRFTSFSVDPPVLTKMNFCEPGTEPTAEIQIISRYTEPFHGQAEGEIDGYCRKREIEVKDTDRWSYSFTVDETMASVHFDLELTEEVFNYFTDCAVNIFDSDGEVVVQDGFGQRFMEMDLRHPGPGTYKLEVLGGFARCEDKKSWGFTVVEKFVLGDKVALSGEVFGESDFDLYADLPAVLELTAGGTHPAAPEGFRNCGEIRLVDDRYQQIRLRIPVCLKD